jgi:hypothetical protein
MLPSLPFISRNVTCIFSSYMQRELLYWAHFPISHEYILTHSIFSSSVSVSLITAESLFWTEDRDFACIVHDRLCGPVARVPGYRSRGPWFDSLRYQIFWEVAGLERGPLNLMSTIEELLERNISGCGLESRGCGRGDQLNLSAKVCINFADKRRLLGRGLRPRSLVLVCVY